MSKESMMNKAQGEEPKRVDSSKPAGSKRGPEIGNETKADVKGTQEGGSRAEGANSPIGSTKLSHAVKELHSQHPIHHSDHGPHHGRTDHIRHEPLHGMKSGGYGR
jgi:hypothetical protein